METIIIHSADTATLQKIKTFLGTLKVSYETMNTEEDESPYDPEFVKMVLERAESARQGNVIEYTDELRKELFGK